MIDTIIPYPLGDNPPTARLIYGVDVREGLRLLPDKSVQVCCTSPPYWGLRDYGTDPEVWGGDAACDHDWGTEGRSGQRNRGNTSLREGKDQEPWAQGQQVLHPSTGCFCAKCGAWKGSLGLEPTPELYVEHLVLIFRELRRVLHPTGTFWLNLGDSYMSHAAKDMGNLGGREGDRVKSEEGYGDSVLFGHGSVPGLKDKDLVGVPWRVALALQADGWWLRNSIIWHKASAMPSSVQDRFSCKYEFVFLFAKQARYFFDLEAVKVPFTYGAYDDDGNFTPAQSWDESGEGTRKMDQTDGQLGHLAGSPRRVGRGLFASGGKNPGDLWTFSHAPYRGSHFATWPPKLVERMILAGSSEKGRCPTCKSPWQRVAERKGGRVDRPKHKYDPGRPDGMSLRGGRIVAKDVVHLGWKPTCTCPAHEPERCVVLDTFSGSATTGMVALQNGRHYIGLDLNEKYLPLACARIEGRDPPQEAPPDADAGVFDLFGL